MLLRQLLQRPLSRSVATAATWWPTPPAPPLPLHDSCRNYSLWPSKSGRDGARSGRDGARERIEREKIELEKIEREESSRERSDRDNSDSPSLFEQLFPEEAEKQHKQSAYGSQPKRTSTWVSQLFDELPHFPLHGEELNAHDSDNPSQTPGDEDVDHHAITPFRAKSMLILSAASKYLLESDFLRLGPKGKHVEGWVGGIVKVIQARDPDTLEPLGHYFVLFDHPSAARLYKEEVQRLWLLGKKYVPGAHHGKDSERRQPVSPGLLTDRGENVAALLRSFTLIPPSQRYYLVLGDEQPEQQSSSSSSSDGGGGSGGAGRRVEQLDQGASFVDALARRAGTRFLVLVTVDGGRISLETLRRAIEDDGIDRNLPWRVKGLGTDGYGDGAGGGGEGILPFGRSVVKSQDHDPEQSLRNQAERATMEQQQQQQEGEGEEGDEGSSNGSGGVVPGSKNDGDKAADHDRKYRRYPRFIVPFEDGAEAHRFVRSWHRREVVLRMAHEGSGGNTNANTNSEPVTWEESRLINAAVLW